jgi:hypothetical protein
MSQIMHCGRMLATVAISGFPLLGCGSTSPPLVATHVAFESQPSATVASAQPLGNVRVSVLTAAGQIATGTNYQVAISLSASDTAAHLAGTTTVQTTTGVAIFPDLTVVRAGTAFRLVARATGLDSVVSQPFAITPGPASQLRFDAFDSAFISVGAAIPAVVRVTDAGGNTIPGATNPVTVGYTRTGSYGTTVAPDGLLGPTTVAAVNGVATFNGLTFHRSGGYTLSATASGLSGAASGPLLMHADSMTKLLFLTQPPNALATAALKPFSVLQVDDYGNGLGLFPGLSYSATLSMGNNPTGAVLGGTLSAHGPGVNALIFGNVSIDRAGTGYTLVATSGGWTVTSASFSIQ